MNEGQSENKYKVYVKVEALFDRDGTLTPIAFWWSDGRRFEIDRVTDVRNAASLKAGGQGMRYTCVVAGKQVYLFYEVDRWFIEGKG